MECYMFCRICENLEHALEARRSEFIEATSLAYFQISKKFAAYKYVEMERARAELQEHRMVCLAAVNSFPAIPAPAILRLAKPDRLQSGQVKTAA
jgi:hypothetical protein